MLFRSFPPLIIFVAVEDSGRKGGGGEVEDPGPGGGPGGPGGGGDNLNVQLHPAAPAGDQYFQYFDGEIKRLLYPLLNILVFVHCHGS